jgi:hypothetical protein
MEWFIVITGTTYIDKSVLHSFDMCKGGSTAVFFRTFAVLLIVFVFLHYVITFYIKFLLTHAISL